jgi:CheY-like chemotaxis protein
VPVEGVVVSDVAQLLNGLAALLWVALGLAALLILRRILTARSESPGKLGAGPGGVPTEFAEAKIDQAIRGTDETSRRAVGQAAKRSILDRLQRNADLVARARILWVDDHPENNTPVIELLQRFGAAVETPRSNAEALALLRGSRYEVVITDMARDNEGPGGELKGIELADQVYAGWTQPVLLFTARFDPTRLPGKTADERLELVSRMQRIVFARTNRMDEALHYIIDMLER